MESLDLNPDAQFWRGKKVLVTGHTGFKGAWLCFWLKRIGAEVTGIALPPASELNLFSLTGLECEVEHRVLDIREGPKLRQAIRDSGAEIVFHLAAQSLVREGYRNPLSTFETNFGGTANLLDALRDCVRTRVAVLATTDKVYQNVERFEPYSEEDRLGGHDPYSASKSAAEMVAASYRESFLATQGIAVATARAGNVIGGGDWSRDRLIPDCIGAWQRGEVAEIRRPDAIRPWQHVLDPLAGYLRLAERLWNDPSLASAYNFGPSAAAAVTVREAVSFASDCWGKAKAPVRFGDGIAGPKESGLLLLDSSRARRVLGFEPRWPVATAMKRTVAWYQRAAGGEFARDLCAEDLDHFERSADGTV